MSSLIRKGRPRFFAPEWPDERDENVSWRTRPVSDLELGAVTTVNMYQGGFETLGDVHEATDKELKAIKLVGEVTIRNKIRPRIKRWAWEPRKEDD